MFENSSLFEFGRGEVGEEVRVLQKQCPAKKEKTETCPAKQRT